MNSCEKDILFVFSSDMKETCVETSERATVTSVNGGFGVHNVSSIEIKYVESRFGNRFVICLNDTEGRGLATDCIFDVKPEYELVFERKNSSLIDIKIIREKTDKFLT